ncbi:MAG: hypothetical protein JSR24_00035 [Proteobacteria bacterium]|nr:hypothetical protein [Pseudomonadota bacterium]
MAQPNEKKESIKVLSLIELLRMTRLELCGLLTEIAGAMGGLPEGSRERHNAEAKLRQIR